MAGLPPKWRCKGGDPFREAQSLKGVRVTSPEAFLKIRNATSLREVQSILMSLPPSVVVAGLDGQPVLRYSQLDEPATKATAEQEVKRILKQAQVFGANVVVHDDVVQVAFRTPETDNERYLPLSWHITEATGRKVEYVCAKRKGITNPRALLKSMLPEGCRITNFEATTEGERIAATITGLAPRDLEGIASEFFHEYGVTLSVKGQLSLF
jgi:hypothetical protein